MKTLKYLMLVLFASLCGCTEEKEVVYYTLTYPVERIAVDLSLEGLGEEEDPAVTALAEEIAARVAADAPVQAGGYYKLEFSMADSGHLKVETATDAGSFSGQFVRRPGEKDFEVRFGEWDYTCKVMRYKQEEVNLVCLEVDVTAYYRTLYPEAGITEVTRMEYTSVRAN